MKTRKTTQKPQVKVKPQEPPPVGIQWPVFDSIRNCSKATGISEAILKQSKDNGCMAFRGSRVYFGEWLRFHFTPKSTDGREVLDLEYEQARFTKEKADELVKKRLKEEKESEFMAELEGMLNEQLVLPCRAWLMNAPASLAGRCNPSNPDVARKVIDDSFQKEFFPLMRTKLVRKVGK